MTEPQLDQAPKVVGLRGAVPAAGEPDSEIVSRLEQLFEDARQGNIVGIAYAVVRSGEVVETVWLGKADSHRMCYGAARLFYRVMAAEGESNDCSVA